MSDDDKKTCTTTQLIAGLQKQLRERGDLPVYLDDPDTNWVLPIGIMFREADEYDPARLEITSGYYGRPEGDLCGEPEG